jgi:hypothetical protein
MSTPECSGASGFSGAILDIATLPCQGGGMASTTRSYLLFGLIQVVAEPEAEGEPAVHPQGIERPPASFVAQSANLGPSYPWVDDGAAYCA